MHDLRAASARRCRSAPSPAGPPSGPAPSARPPRRAPARCGSPRPPAPGGSSGSISGSLASTSRLLNLQARLEEYLGSWKGSALQVGMNVMHYLMWARLSWSLCGSPKPSAPRGLVCIRVRRAHPASRRAARSAEYDSLKWPHLGAARRLRPLAAARGAARLAPPHPCAIAAWQGGCRPWSPPPRRRWRRLRTRTRPRTRMPLGIRWPAPPGSGSQPLA